MTHSAPPPKAVLIPSQEAGLRIDRWFKLRAPHIPYGLVQKWVRCGRIRVNGQKVDPGYRLALKDRVVIPPHQTLPPAPILREAVDHVRDQDLEAFPQWIVYEDEHLAVINKPSGLAVQGGTRTLRHLDGILQKRAHVEGCARWLLVHRLDKDTSGLLVLAKNQAMARQLAQGFQQSRIRKVYWGLTVGVPREKEGVIRLPLAKTPDPSYEKVSVNQEGAQATSLYKVLDRSGNLAWLHLEPLTGRTHQLRVHCASLGTPLLGDGKYGGAAAHPWGRTLLHLHARRIDLSQVLLHPLVIAAPLSPIMVETFERMGFDLHDGEERS